MEKAVPLLELDKSWNHIQMFCDIISLLFQEMDTSDEFEEWVEIQFPIPSNIIRDNDDGNNFFTDSSVFPPNNNNREGLIPSISSSSSSIPLSSSSEDEENKVKDESGSRFKVGFGCLRQRIVEIALRMKNYAASKAMIRLFFTSVTTTGLGAFLFVFLIYLRRRKQVKLLENKQQQQKLNELILLIKGKDQKISELLLQIAQLNDNLLERRRVPVLRVS